MDLLLEALMNPSQMTRPQLLLLVILAFVVIASLYFVWRLYRILMTSRKQPYVPNIGLKRSATAPARPRPNDSQATDARQDGPDDKGSSNSSGSSSNAGNTASSAADGGDGN